MERVDLGELDAALDGATPTLDDEGRRVAASLYRLLGDGEPVAPTALARASDVAQGRVEALLSAWPGVFRDEGGLVVGFWGLALGKLEPTHEVEVDGRPLYAWCAWDTLFLPDALGGRARVRSSDPQSGRRIELTVTPRGVEDVSHPDAVVSFLVPDGPFTSDDVVSGFCHFVHFFESRESGEKWVRMHEGTFLLSLEEAFELGRLRNRRILQDVPAR